MLKAILVRATDILQELEAAPISGTYFKAAEDIPQMVQDFEVYIAFMGNPSHTQDSTSPKEFPNRVTFPGRLIGAQILTGNSFTDRCNLLDYADLISAKFNERPLLNDVDMRPLNGVTECIFTGGQVIEQSYPANQNEIIRRQYTFSLQIVYKRFRTLSR